MSSSSSTAPETTNGVAINHHHQCRNDDDDENDHNTQQAPSSVPLPHSDVRMRSSRDGNGDNLSENNNKVSAEEEVYPPDHPRGFVVAIAAFFTQFAVFGIFDSFPVFAYAMTQDASLGRPSETLVSAANGFAVGLAPIFGIPGGFLVDHIGPRNSLFITMIATVLAMICSAQFAHSGYQLVALYSIFGGIAMGILTTAGGAATASWFEKKRAFATGITFAGGGGGSMLIPAIAGRLLNQHDGDWRLTFRYISFFVVIGVISACFVRFRVEHHKKKDDGNEEFAANPDEHSAFCDDNLENSSDYGATTATKGLEDGLLAEQDPASPLIASGTKLDDRLHRKMLKPYELVKILLHRDFQSIFWCFVCFSFAFYGILYCVVPYATSMGRQGTPYEAYPIISVDKASSLFTVLGAFQVVSSIGLGLMATKVKDRVVFTACSGVGAIACALWINARTFEVFAVTMVFLGMASSGAFAVIPSIIAHHFWGPNLGKMMGLCICSMAFGGFLGPIVVTATQSAQGGSYTVAISLIGIASAAGGFICATAIREV